MPHKRVLAFAGLLGLAMAVDAAPLRAQDAVTVFDRPPTVGQAEQALGLGAPGETQLRYRSILIDPAAAGSSRPAASGSSRPQAAAAGEFSTTAIAMHINFDFNSSAIRPDSEGYIVSIAELLRKHPEIKLLIEGHTDAVGSRAANLRLSKLRALAVRDALVAKYGVAPAHLFVAGRGPDEPLNPADPNNPDNRRVQFRVHS